jgi:hypothetical protein
VPIRVRPPRGGPRGRGRRGVRYASCKLPDDETFVVLLQLDNDEENPLVTVPAFKDFQAARQSWVDGAPVVEELAPVGSYRLF